MEVCLDVHQLEEGEGEKLVIVIEYLLGRDVAQTGCAHVKESTVVIDLPEIIYMQGYDEAGREKCCPKTVGELVSPPPIPATQLLIHR